MTSSDGAFPFLLPGQGLNFKANQLGQPSSGSCDVSVGNRPVSTGLKPGDRAGIDVRSFPVGFGMAHGEVVYLGPRMKPLVAWASA